MREKPQEHIQNLVSWELPQLNDLEHKLIAELSRKKLTFHLDEDTLGENLQTLIFDRVRQLARLTVNEAITYWLQNAVEGGTDHPEIGIEFPYLEYGEETEPLRMSYFVGSENGLRTELKRVDLERVLIAAMQPYNPPPKLERRIKAVAQRLRISPMSGQHFTPCRARVSRPCRAADGDVTDCV